MDYTNFNEEQHTNYAKISGVVCSEITKTHQVEGETFYEFLVAVSRLSKNNDYIPVTIPERCLMDTKIEQGNFVQLSGEFRSYNKLCKDRSRLILHLFAKDINVCAEQKEFENEIHLTGYVCKEPVYRKTPFEREICDVLLAVNRTNYHKSDYVPCIMWGRNARFMAGQNIGCKVELVGRIQSRDYTKTLPDGTTENKTAYEVSCQRIALVANISNMKTESENQKNSKEII